MKLVYVAGPYRGKTAWEVECNIQRARELGAEVAELGAYPVIPHSNTSHFDGLASDELWLEGTLELMRRCDAVIFHPEWKRSSGSRAERAEAERLGLPCFDNEYQLRGWLAAAKVLAPMILIPEDDEDWRPIQLPAKKEPSEPVLSPEDRIAALEAKCDLLSASLRQADAANVTARAEEREWCAGKCDELGDRYDVDSHGQRTCRELAKIIRSGA